MKLKMTLNGVPRVREPVDSGKSWKTVYGVASTFQVSPTQAGAVINRRVYDVAAVDFEDGGDLLLFDSLDHIDPVKAFPLSRTEKEVHPRTGEKLNMVSYLNIGGFVPLGARREDGSPHPAAGTGFALSTYRGYPVNFATGKLPQGDIYTYQQIIQLRYDGEAFHVMDRYKFQGKELFPGYEILNRGISVAISDGSDLLSGIVAGPMVRENEENGFCIPTKHPAGHAVLGRNYGSALCRWSYRAGSWRPTEMVPVSGPDLSSEPSLVRDTDGSLLMAVRGRGLKEPAGAVHDGLENTFCHFRVYRSADGGKTWQSILHKPLMRAATPVVLNLTLGGHPYLAANPCSAARLRDKLCLWPLTSDRRDVEDPICVLDANAVFGPPQQVENKFMEKGNEWMLDHPVATVCRLGDGRWHDILCFRVSDKGVNKAGAAPTPLNGPWLERVTVEGEQEIPAWRF